MLGDLARLASPRQLRQLASGQVPGQVIIQLTDACNAHCPQCEMRVANRFDRSSLADDAIARVLDAAAARGVAAVSFTGGEPFLQFDRLVHWLGHANKLGIPFLRTGTNGFFLRHAERPGFEQKVAEVAGRLAESGVRNVWISIDSADPAVHERMRGLPGVIDGITRALPIFEAHGLWPTANLGVNRNVGGRPLRLAPGAGEEAKEEFFQEAVEAFRGFFKRVLGMGFTIVNFCYPMSVESEPDKGLLAVYRASSADDVVRFRPDEKAILFLAMSAAVAEVRSRLRVFSPRSTLTSLARTYASGESDGYACRGGLDFFFVDAARGEAFPCGFRSDESLGRYWDMAPPKGAKASCTRCDWECWRDPSTLTGPLLELRQAPLSLLRRFRQDRPWLRLWREDLAYYRACDYFDGRRPPDPAKLSRFGNEPKAAPTLETVLAAG